MTLHSTVRVNIVSDLHMGATPFSLPDTESDIIVLAGDISRPHKAIAWALELPKPVVYVPGNHEFYGLEMDETLLEMHKLCEGSHVHVLHNQSVVLKGVRFLGSTLWSTFDFFEDPKERTEAIRQAQELIRDFSTIRTANALQPVFSPTTMDALHHDNRTWLQQMLGTAWAGPTVVVTHHAPSAKSIHPRFEGSLLNACFASHSEDLMSGERVALWIHGHMHDSLDYTVNGTRVVCNPRGYFKDGIPENPCFDPSKVIDIPITSSTNPAT